MAGLKKLLARDYDISSTLEDIKRSINRQRQERIRQELDEEAAKYKAQGGGKLARSIAVPSKLSSASDLDALIFKLNEIKTQLALFDEIEVSFVVGGDE